MKNTIKILALAASLQLMPSAFAQTSVEQGRDLMVEQTMKTQVWGLTPQIGQVSYNDPTGTYSSRATIGLGFDLNIATLAYPTGDKNTDNRADNFYYGINTGVLYSHTGYADSNFFGTSNSSSTGSNLVMIPADVKIGYNLTDSFRLTAQGGGNIIYRSAANSIDMGDGSASPDSLWKIYPNVGISAELQVGKNVSLIAHPDMTFTNGNNLFVATIGATIMGN